MGLEKKFVIIGLIAILVCISLSGCNEQKPQTLIVGSGEKYTTIQGAIDAAHNGDTIQVQIGTYPENIVIDKQLTLISSDTTNTVIDGGKKGHVIEIKSNNVEIFGFMIRNSDTSSTDNPSGIYLDGTQNCKIEYNIISYNIWGIYLQESNNNIIIGNTVTSNDAHGIRLWNSSNNQLTDNTITNNSASGFLISQSDRNIISNNLLSSNHYDGIILDSSSANLITNNTITNNRFGILIQTGLGKPTNSNTITRNTIMSNKQYGINLNCPQGSSEISGNQITGNTIKENNDGQIKQGELCSDNIIENNVIS
jgi:nitrous oxidase accessory protein